MGKIAIIIFLSIAIIAGIYITSKQYIKYDLSTNFLGTARNENKSFTIISTGDIGLGRYVNYKISEQGDPHFPFLNIASYLQEADLTVINLENPLIDNCPIIVTGFKFCGDDENVEGLVFAGVDAVNLANNHTTNFGIEGLEETKELLESKGIAAFGLKDIIRYIDINGYKIALVGFVELENNWEGLSNATDENIEKLITEAGESSDVVIASLHWGPEYTHHPSVEQVRLARLAIDSGADIVLGNHAHWVQPIEIYKDKYIVYAQGNTVFDQDWSLKTREGVLYEFEYKNDEFELIDERFTIIDNNSQPRFADVEESKRIKSYINSTN